MTYAIVPSSTVAVAEMMPFIGRFPLNCRSSDCEIDAPVNLNRERLVPGPLRKRLMVY
jgi:hypothetical protein